MKLLLAFTFLFSLALGIGLLVTREELAEIRETQNKVLLNEVDLTKIVYSLNTRQMHVENIIGDSEGVRIAMSDIYEFNSKMNTNEIPPKGMTLGVGGGDSAGVAKSRSKPAKKR